MHVELIGVHAQIDAWRRQGADRVDPWRFALMAAMANRAARHDGAARQRLDVRLQELVEDYAVLLANPPVAKLPRSAGDSPLKQLLEQFATAPRLDAVPQGAPVAQACEAGEQAPAIDTTPMPVLDEFQQLWSRIRIDSLLRQCLDSLSEDAGPLHSSVLTYRAMALMREVSPGYLQHFVAYADVLTWMEQLGGGAVTGSDVDGAVGVRKPARANSTRRKKLAANPET